MADALCGPSNPLQQFKQQTQFDRTLQQDRLTSRHAPAQGFRSHDPNVGVLDSEFEAFQAGVPLPDLPQFQQRPPSFVGPSQTPSWANDFQRMQISPSPAFQQQPVVRPAPANANWAQGLREHVARTAPRAQTAAQSPQAFQQMARYGMNGFQSNFAQPNYLPNVTSKGKELVTEQYDEAAFAAAFDQASQDLLVGGADQMEVEQPAYEAGASTADFDIDQETHVEKARRAAMEALRPHQRRLSQDLEAQRRESISQEFKGLERLQDEPLRDETVMQEDAEETEQHQQDDDDALAATAKELLEKVEHNKTDKFKNSQFLNLMRKLRDREMKVEGDQMIETAGASTAMAETQGLDTTTTETQDVRQINGHTFTNVTTSGNGRMHLGDVYDTSFPLEATHVDTRPPDTDNLEQYQDHDEGRVAPKDGQEVVDYLNRKGAASPDDIDSEFMMTNPDPSTNEDGVARYPWLRKERPGWATPSWASGYYYPKDMEPDWLSGRS